VTTPFKVGDLVHTPLGKGIVSELRNNRHLVVNVKGRAMVVSDADISLVPLIADRNTTSSSGRSAGSPAQTSQAVEGDPRSGIREVDLHGLTVQEALARVDEVMNDAMLADLPQVRFIHGRSGGRIRSALEKRLRAIGTVKGFRRDPHNAGVTIVDL
jgi:dsDNA-specific endonuclease/ATPase MutS2